MIIVPFDTTRNAFIADVIIVNPSNKKYVIVKALWDTGAAISSVPNNVIQKLGANSISTIYVQGSTGGTQSFLYYLKFLIDGKVENVYINNNNLQFALIGMDIISKGELLIKNDKGMLTMYFDLYKKLRCSLK